MLVIFPLAFLPLSHSIVDFPLLHYYYFVDVCMWITTHILKKNRLKKQNYHQILKGNTAPMYEMNTIMHQQNCHS